MGRDLPDTPVDVVEVSPTSPDAEFCLSHYFRELEQRFDGGFDPANSLAPTLDAFRPPRGTFLVLYLDGRAVGCGGFKFDPPDAAYIKRMWIDPTARGLGLGRRLLQELEQVARARGYRMLRLETEKALTEAQQLYRSAGFREVPPFNDERYADHWFEKHL
jgi:GNAT superfamily N-acetyltransferase